MIKNNLQNIAAALLVTAALAAPLSVKAADDTTTAAASATPAKKVKAPEPVTGKVSAVDKTAKTFKVGTHTFTVSDSTKWEGDLTLDSLVAGTTKVTVAYTKDGETNNATNVKAAKSTKK